MNNVVQLRPEAVLVAIEQSRKKTDNQSQIPPTGGGGEPPMDARITKLENLTEKTSEKLSNIDRDLALLKGEVSGFKSEAFRSFATKADVADAKNSIIMWVVSAILLAQLLPAILKKFGL